MKRLSQDIIYKSDHLGRDLAGKSVRGGMFTMTAQGIQLLLHTAGTVILARLLTPNDFGLVGMVIVIVNFAQMFKDAGLSMATIQKDKITHEQISTLFWINLLISSLLGICVLVSSPLVAWFYGHPELTAVTAALSVPFFVTGLMIQHQALLHRHMQFGTLAIIQIASLGVSLFVTVGLALCGWRYWALVGGTITTALVTTAMTLFFCPWIPGRMKKGTGVRKMLCFGGNLTGFNFMNYFARNADNILIGKFLGAGPLGVYTKAYSLLMFPLQQINAPTASVALPALNQLRDQPDRYRRYYTKALSLILIVTLPLVTFLAVFSDHVILIVLGPQWRQASTVFLILAIAGLTQPFSNTLGWLFISQGRVNEMLRCGMINSAISIASFAVGLYWGIVGVAAAYALTGLIRTPFTLWCATRKGPVRLADLVVPARIPIIASFVIGICLVLLRFGLGEMHPLCVLVQAMFLALVGVGGVLFGSQAGRQFFQESINPALLLLWSRPR